MRSSYKYHKILKHLYLFLLFLIGCYCTVTVLFQVTDKSKDDRRKIHEAIKDGFGKEVYSNTVDRGTKKFITIFKTRKGGEFFYDNICSIEFYLHKHMNIAYLMFK